MLSTVKNFFSSIKSIKLLTILITSVIYCSFNCFSLISVFSLAFNSNNLSEIISIFLIASKNISLNLFFKKGRHPNCSFLSLSERNISFIKAKKN